MNYFNWMWGKKKSDENEKLNENIKTNTNDDKLKSATTTTSTTTTSKSDTATIAQSKNKRPRRTQRTVEEKQLDFVKLILDPPINHVKITPQLYDQLVNIKRYGDSKYSPTQALWINGIIGGTFAFLISNSIFKNNPLVRFRNVMIYGSTFMGAYYWSNKYYETSNFEQNNFLYKKNYYLKECDIYFANEVLPYLIEREIHNSKYRISKSGDIIDPETSEVVLKNYNGCLKKYFKPLTVNDNNDNNNNNNNKNYNNSNKSTKLN